jgi:two-component system, OmpR family, KDP operon response regulator KdpE
MTAQNAKTVLIIEDSLDIANFVKFSLEHMGLEAHHSSSPEKAIAFLETNRPDLIILDIGLPGMTGWQLLDMIKEKRENEGIFVVVTTAFTDPANRVVGKLQHVDRYLIKPFQYDQLKQIMDELLG